MGLVRDFMLAALFHSHTTHLPVEPEVSSEDGDEGVCRQPEQHAVQDTRESETEEAINLLAHLQTQTRTPTHTLIHSFKPSQLTTHSLTHPTQTLAHSLTLRLIQ